MSRSGRLGGYDLAAADWTSVCETPAGEIGTVSLVLTNRNTNAATVPIRVRVALKENATGDPTVVDIMEWDAIVKDIPLRIEGIAMSAGNMLAAYSDSINVSALVYGFEELADV